MAGCLFLPPAEGTSSQVSRQRLLSCLFSLSLTSSSLLCSALHCWTVRPSLLLRRLFLFINPLWPGLARNLLGNRLFSRTRCPSRTCAAAHKHTKCRPTSRVHLHRLSRAGERGREPSRRPIEIEAVKKKKNKKKKESKTACPSFNLQR